MNWVGKGGGYFFLTFERMKKPKEISKEIKLIISKEMCSEKLPAKYTMMPRRPKNIVPKEYFIQRTSLKANIFIISQNTIKHKLCKTKVKRQQRKEEDGDIRY